MRAINKLIGVLFISLLATSCATAPVKLDQKYNFDNELQEVKGIINYKIDSWQPIDSQSLIIQTDVNDYYLVILQQPAPDLPYTETIGATVTVNEVKPGYDVIIVSDSSGATPYVIQKIYKLNGREQAQEIRKQVINSK